MIFLSKVIMGLVVLSLSLLGLTLAKMESKEQKPNPCFEIVCYSAVLESENQLRFQAEIRLRNITTQTVYYLSEGPKTFIQKENGYLIDETIAGFSADIDPHALIELQFRSVESGEEIQIFRNYLFPVDHIKLPEKVCLLWKISYSFKEPDWNWKVLFDRVSLSSWESHYQSSEFVFAFK